MKQSCVLVANDDEETREIIRVLLAQEGYDVSEARDEREALEYMNDHTDLYILDIMMPYIDGYGLCEQIRRHNSTPILSLIAKGAQKDKAQSFFKGVDSYLAKPFSHLELLVRVKAVLCRFMVYQGEQAEVEKRCRILQIRDARIEKRSKAAYVKGGRIAMTDLGYQLLYFMTTHRNQTFSAEELFVSVWSEPYFTSADNTLMVHIRNVRKKIEEDARNPKYIRTIWGKRYRSE